MVRLPYQLEFGTLDIRDVHIVGGGRQIFQLLVGEDIESRQVDLCVTVFASLGGGHVDDLAGTALDDDKAVLSQGRALHRVGEGGASVAGGLEGVLMLLGPCQYNEHMRRVIARPTCASLSAMALDSLEC